MTPPTPQKVRVLKCSSPDLWYSNAIGFEFNVIWCPHFLGYMVVWNFLIDTFDKPDDIFMFCYILPSDAQVTKLA